MDRACIRSYQLWNRCHPHIQYHLICNPQLLRDSIYPLDILGKCHLRSRKSPAGRERCVFHSGLLSNRNQEGTVSNLSNRDLHSSQRRKLQELQELFDRSSQLGRLCKNILQQVSRNQVCMVSLNQKPGLGRHSQLGSPCRQSHPN